MHFLSSAILENPLIQLSNIRGMIQPRPISITPFASPARPASRARCLGRPRALPRPARGLVLLVLPWLLAACRDSQVDTYRVPKEKDAVLPATVTTAPAAMPEAAGVPAPLPPPVSGGMAGTPVVTAGPGLVWVAPAGWSAKPLGAMRKGSYAVPNAAGAPADLSITAFPGAVGGELANVNRWRGQLSLPPVTEAGLAGSVTRFGANGLTFTLVDLAATDPANPQRMLGAMVPFEGAMWFFKLSGPAALVGATKPAFLEFLQTVKPAAP
jgi:hypothetical protein